MYCLIYAEWGFTRRYTEDNSLAPEWSDKHLTANAIAQDNPTGHRLFNEQISKVISKPAESELGTIFQDGDIGVSGYIPSSGAESSPDSDSNNEINLRSVYSGRKRQKLKSGLNSTNFIFDYDEPLTKKMPI